MPPPSTGGGAAGSAATAGGPAGGKAKMKYVPPPTKAGEWSRPKVGWVWGGVTRSGCSGAGAFVSPTFF